MTDDLAIAAADAALARLIASEGDPGPELGAVLRGLAIDAAREALETHVTSLTPERVAVFNEWAQSTFGNGLDTERISAHIRSELDEISASPTDTEEWCDVILLALNGAGRASKSQLPDGALSMEVANYVLDVLAEKMERNYRRTWKRSDDGLIRHATEG